MMAAALEQKSGKKVVLALFGAILVVVGHLFWIGRTGGSQHVPGSQPGIGFVKADVGAREEPSGATASSDAGGPVTKTIVDKQVRDELRRRILAGWAAGDDGEVARAAKQGKFVPAPVGTAPGSAEGGPSSRSDQDRGAMDPKYIQEVVRTEFFPMAQKCYEELLARKDSAAGRPQDPPQAVRPRGATTVEMSFTIVADEKLGGIVEDASVASDGGVADERMSTCMRESLTTLAFRPPAHGGVVTVVYPIHFSPDEEHDK